MEMLFTPNTALSGTPSTAEAGKAGRPAAPAEGFAALLALLQAGPQAQSPTGAKVPALPREITMPGGEEARRTAMTDLLAQLQDLAGATLTALENLEARGGAQEAAEATLAQAAAQLGQILHNFDRATGADSFQSLGANLAALKARTGVAPGHAAHDRGPELARAMFGLAAGLLGLADGAAEAATSAQRPAEPAPGARKIIPEAGPARQPSAPWAQGLSLRPPRQAEAAQPPLRQSAESADGGPDANNRFATPPAAPLPRAAELLSMAVQARPSTPESMPLPQPAVPQGGSELRLAPLGDLVEARSTAQPQPPAQPDGFARNLANQIRSTSFSEGRTRIELSPQGLGSIEIDLHADEAGKLRVVLRAENPVVLNALRGDRAALLSVLGDSGVAVEDSALDFEAFGQHRHRQQDAAPLAPGTGMAAEDEADSPEPAPRDPRHVPGTGRLNILT